MNQAIDYGQMARMLMMQPQLVGDLVRGPKRWFTGETPAPQLLGPTGGGGSRGPSQWRTQEGASAYEAQSGLRPGTLAPVNPNRGDVTNLRPAWKQPAPYNPYKQNPDMEMVKKQWHANTPNMGEALKKLTPSEANKLFDMLFKAPPGVEFP